MLYPLGVRQDSRNHSQSKIPRRHNMWQFWTLASICLVLLYKYFDKKYRFWADRGLASVDVVWPLGSLFYRIRTTVLEYELANLAKYGKLYGSYNGIEPVLVISDYELAKKIMIKDFQHFNTRVNFRAYHKMFNENLVFAGFERWKRVRTIASPAFTIAKLKSMNPLMQSCVDKLVFYLDKVCEDNGHGVIKTKEVIGGFTMDIISSAAFGTETNANDLRRAPNPIVVNAENLFILPIMKAISTFTFPRCLLKLMGIEHFLDSASFDFFIDFTRHIVRQRRMKGNFRNDFIQFLLDAEVDEEEFKNVDFNDLTAGEKEQQEKQKSNKSLTKNLRLTEDEIIAQSIVFLIAGYETTATTLTHAVHELSLNTSVQDKLYEEYLQVLSDHDESSNEYHDNIMNKTPYLEATIKETLRKYPPLSRIVRNCNTDGYKLNEQLTLDRGQQIVIMVIAMQRNPEYYTDPDRFIPERFLSPNAKDLPFLPWGTGPRNCIGMRFSLQEMKLCLTKLIQRYRFEKIDKNCDPELRYHTATPLLNCYEFPTKVSLR